MRTTQCARQRPSEYERATPAATALPTHYFHVVFTLPAELQLRGVARGNRAVVYTTS